MAIGFATLLNAQQYPSQRNPFTPEHDFRIGFGNKPFEAANITFMEDFDLVRPSIFDPKDFYSGARYTTNSFFLEYIYQANSWFGVGVTANYLAYFNNYYDGITDLNVGVNLVQHISLYPTIRFTWLNHNSFRAYSSFGVGQRIVFEHDVVHSIPTNEVRSSIAGQITLLGFTFGKHLYGFTDLLTLGSQGMLNVGLGYRISIPQK